MGSLATMFSLTANAIPDPDAFFLYEKNALCYNTCGQVIAMKQARARNVDKNGHDASIATTSASVKNWLQ